MRYPIPTRPTWGPRAIPQEPRWVELPSDSVSKSLHWRDGGHGLELRLELRIGRKLATGDCWFSSQLVESREFQDALLYQYENMTEAMVVPRKEHNEKTERLHQTISMLIHEDFGTRADAMLEVLLQGANP